MQVRTRHRSSGLLAMGVLVAMLAISSSPALAFQQSHDIPVDPAHPLGGPSTITASYDSIFYATFDPQLNSAKLVRYNKDTGAFQGEFLGLTMPTHVRLPQADPSPRLWAWKASESRFYQISGNGTLIAGSYVNSFYRPFAEFAVRKNSQGAYCIYVAKNGGVIEIGNYCGLNYNPVSGQAHVSASQEFLAVGSEGTGQVQVYKGTTLVGTINGAPGPMHLDVIDAGGSGDILIGRGTGGTPEHFAANGTPLTPPMYTGGGDPQARFFHRHDSGTLYQFIQGPISGNTTLPSLFASYAPDSPPPGGTNPPPPGGTNPPPPGGTQPPPPGNTNPQTPPEDGCQGALPPPDNSTGTGTTTPGGGDTTQPPSGGTGGNTSASASGSSLNVVSYPLDTHNQTPRADFRVGTLGPRAGQVIVFDASASRDPDGCITEYRWRFGDGSGRLITTSPAVAHIYAMPGIYRVKLRVKDNRGARRTVSKRLVIGKLSRRVPPGSSAQPVSRLRKRINGKRLRRAPHSFSGVSEVPEGTSVRYVRVALARKLKRGRCAWYKDVTRSWVKAKGCGGKYRRWITVSHDADWSFTVPKTVRMRPGLYYFMTRAIDTEGHIEKKKLGKNFAVFRVRHR